MGKGFKKSKRETLLYVCVFLWLIIGVIAITHNSNLSGLAAYFASLAPFVIGYIYGETKRPSGGEG